MKNVANKSDQTEGKGVVVGKVRGKKPVVAGKASEKMGEAVVGRKKEIVEKADGKRKLESAIIGRRKIAVKTKKSLNAVLWPRLLWSGSPVGRRALTA